MADLVERSAQVSDKLKRKEKKQKELAVGRIIAVIKKCEALFCILFLKELSVYTVHNETLTQNAI